MTAAAFHVSGVNGIADLHVELSKPGVYVARGPNGAGKTSAISAITAACGGNATAEPTDGMPKGRVEGPGCTLTVGKQRRLNGLPTVQLASTSALGRLVDPGLKDPAAAARARVEALLELTPIAVDAAAACELGGDLPDLNHAAGGESNLVAAAERVRRKAHELARAAETQRDQAAGRSAAARQQLQALGELPAEAPPLEQARAEETRLIREAERISVAARARAELEEQKQGIQEALGERPDAQAAARVAEEWRKRVIELERELAAAETSLEAAWRDHERIKQKDLDWRTRKAILDRPLEGPTADDVEVALKAAEAAQARTIIAGKWADACALRKVIADADSTAMLCGQRADELRAVAARVPEVMGRLLARAGVPGLTVQEGRLAVQKSDGTMLDFERRLSFGQKVRIALQVALHRFGGDAAPVLIPLEPEFWQALDPERKREVHEIARELNVTILTEEPDCGSLRVEPMEAAHGS